jgi:hypothetical protein
MSTDDSTTTSHEPTVDELGRLNVIAEELAEINAQIEREQRDKE